MTRCPRLVRSSDLRLGALPPQRWPHRPSLDRFDTSISAIHTTIGTRGSLSGAMRGSTGMRQDVTFSSNGMSCAGWLYVPEDLQEGEERPTIIMAHGFSAVKEMYLANFAEKFEEAGFVVLVFDYRYFGDSEGEPRGRLIPAEQHEDYKNAITWISHRAEVDPDRIGIWGSSYSGGHVLYLASFDKRIKAAVAQVPLVNGWQNAQRLMRPDVFDEFLAALAQDRAPRYTEGTGASAPRGPPKGLCARASSTSVGLPSLRVERGATRKVRAPACPSWLPRENLRRCRHPNLTSGLPRRGAPEPPTGVPGPA